MGRPLVLMADNYYDGRCIAILLANGYDFAQVADETGYAEDAIERIADMPVIRLAIREFEHAGILGVDKYFEMSYYWGGFFDD